ncbi:MAG TPA: sigma-70 family RNA polymerase sigma factor [Pyrinomonadaceae bacterium]
MRQITDGLSDQTSMAHESHTVTEMLVEWSDSRDQESLNKIMPIVYDELRRQAARYLKHERQGHTLQTTALVHEAYVRLIDQAGVRWQNRAHFFAIAAEMMRRILVDYARKRHAAKRGGDAVRVTLNEALQASDQGDLDLITVDKALTKLATLDNQQARVVELRFFGGLNVEETAEVLGISERTVKRDWSVAKAWIRRELRVSS